MKQKIGRRLLGVLLTLAMVLGLMPGMSLTALADLEPVAYMAWNGTAVALVEGGCTDYTVVDDNTTTFEDGKWYVVNATGDGLTNDNRITFNGTVNLILCDGATLNASKGIQGTEDSTLNIYGQSEGTGAFNAVGANATDRTDTFVSANKVGSYKGYAGTAAIVGSVIQHGGKIHTAGGNGGKAQIKETVAPVQTEETVRQQ